MVVQDTSEVPELHFRPIMMYSFVPNLVIDTMEGIVLPNIDSLSPDETCFVISPIGDVGTETRKRADELLDMIVEPATLENGLHALRSDEIAAPGMITTQVISHIIKDRMVVADLTDHNANVFYELALRHAFKKPVVQLMLSGQKLPFDVQGARTVIYELTNTEARRKARNDLTRQIASSLSPGFEIESPITIAARLDDLSRSSTPEIQTMMKAVLDQIAEVNRNINDMTSSGLMCRPDDLKEVLPPLVADKMLSVLNRYSEEIDLLKEVRFAGLSGLYKRRELALKAFSRDIDEELREIVVVGSSLKGLLQKDVYKDIADKLRFKVSHEVRIKFMLTHPIVADFRAGQENRKPTEIGMEILRSLRTLKDWGVKCSDVRLYLGTPTCFAMKTTRRMVVNPYPYISVSYDSPCLLLDSSHTGTPGYFFDEFNSRHFGAWDTGLAVPIQDFDQAIKQCERLLQDYSDTVSHLLERGRSFS